MENVYTLLISISCVYVYYANVFAIISDSSSYIRHLTSVDPNILKDMRLPSHLYSSRGDKVYAFCMLCTL